MARVPKNTSFSSLLGWTDAIRTRLNNPSVAQELLARIKTITADPKDLALAKLSGEVSLRALAERRRWRDKKEVVRKLKERPDAA